MYWTFTGVSKTVICICSAFSRWSQNLYVGKRFYFMHFWFGFCLVQKEFDLFISKHFHFLVAGLENSKPRAELCHCFTGFLKALIPTLQRRILSSPLISSKFKEKTRMQCFWFTSMSRSVSFKRSYCLRAEFTGLCGYYVSVLSELSVTWGIVSSLKILLSWYFDKTIRLIINAECAVWPFMWCKMWMSRWL